MPDRFFLDTNVLICALQADDPDKQGIADALVTRALRERCGVISSQVVQETLHVGIAKLQPGILIDEAPSYFRDVLASLCGVSANDELFEQALLVKARWQCSFFDSPVIADAQQARCTTLYTEDLSCGQQLGELTVVNPFKS